MTDSAPTPSRRVASIDLIRGAVMVLMAIDHVRVYAGVPAMGNPQAPEGYVWSLPLLYLVWAAAIVPLYFACRWFAAVKARRTDWWLRYV